MAYDLHIENSGKTIEEWSSFVESRHDLSPSVVAKATNPKTGEVISVSTPNAATSKSGLYFFPKNTSRGLIVTIKKPSEADIPFLKQITSAFGGVLVGDEGEEY